MNITMQKRAEIALRSIDPVERKRVLKALEALKIMEPQTVLGSRKLHRLITAKPGENLYSYRSSNRFRVILSRDQTTWIVEDIVDHDRLEQLLSKDPIKTQTTHDIVKH